MNMTERAVHLSISHGDDVHEHVHLFPFAQHNTTSAAALVTVTAAHLLCS